MAKRLSVAMVNKGKICEKKRKKDPRLPPKVKQRTDDSNQVEPVKEDIPKLIQATGTIDIDLMGAFITQTSHTLTDSTLDKAQQANRVLAMLYGIQPQNELEAMLASQMVGVHNSAMHFLRLSVHPEQSFEGRDANVNRATKLLRTFTAQIEALNRLRGKGQQKVTVEHVHVNEGGQAIVGHVEGGGGKYEKRG